MVGIKRETGSMKENDVEETTSHRVDVCRWVGCFRFWFEGEDLCLCPVDVVSVSLSTVDIFFFHKHIHINHVLSYFLFIPTLSKQSITHYQWHLVQYLLSTFRYNIYLCCHSLIHHKIRNFNSTIYYNLYHWESPKHTQGVLHSRRETQSI